MGTIGEPVVRRNVDSFLSHIPDFRPYWGEREGFQWREIAQMEVRGQSLPELNRIYFGWKNFALDHMLLSEHTVFYGDAFFANDTALGVW